MVFAGRVSLKKVSKYMKAADCLILPSKREGFGIVTIEAMACGVPVIATKIDKITENIIDHTVDGIILDTREPYVLAKAILNLKMNKDFYKNLSKNAIQKVKDRFTIASVAARHATLYNELYINRLKKSR